MLEQWALVPEQRSVVGERRRSSRRLKPVTGAQGLATVGGASSSSASVPVSRATTPVAPIPLTQKKAAASGEIAARRSTPTPAAAAAFAQAPTVQFKLDELASASVLAPVVHPPITARHATLGPAEPPVRRSSAAVPRDNLRRTPPPDGSLRRTPPPDGSLRRTPPPDGSRRVTPPSLRDSGRRPSLDALMPSGPDSKNKLRRILPPTRMTPSTAFDAVEADFFAREADLYKQDDVDSFDDLDRGAPRRPGAKKRP